MPCSSNSPADLSFSAKLHLAHLATTNLSYPQIQELLSSYELIRTLIWKILEVAPDASAYNLAWKSIAGYGEAARDRLLITENEADFARLQDIINQAVGSMP